MASRPIQWVNSPVLMEAMLRYEQGLLPRSMQLWVEQMLELDGSENTSGLLPSSFDASVD
ncbi:hypothetical protein [Synechococcus sp. BS55D]|uniref:hypothetical protein n=1 Tax=Synechococcus sp. BS55D TaxID=2055943 RepID=UPI0010392063|nr:hypothetical protein [Synechococcus sp. BS55D]TCD55247.1 hypothetical protein CWE16_11460 [Synechococcus sp. BS55D]